MHIYIYLYVRHFDDWVTFDQFDRLSQIYIYIYFVVTCIFLSGPTDLIWFRIGGYGSLN
jgi:hypothetical protein